LISALTLFPFPFAAWQQFEPDGCWRVAQQHLLRCGARASKHRGRT